MELALEEEGNKNVRSNAEASSLKAKNEKLTGMLEEANRVQKEKFKELEEELDELREFKQKVKGLF